jgi:hypothetical protein
VHLRSRALSPSRARCDHYRYSCLHIHHHHRQQQQQLPRATAVTTTHPTTHYHHHVPPTQTQLVTLTPQAPGADSAQTPELTLRQSSGRAPPSRSPSAAWSLDRSTLFVFSREHPPPLLLTSHSSHASRVSTPNPPSSDIALCLRVLHLVCSAAACSHTFSTCCFRVHSISCALARVTRAKFVLFCR